MEIKETTAVETTAAEGQPSQEGTQVQEGAQATPTFSSFTNGKYESWEQVEESFNGYESKIKELEGKKPEFSNPLIKSLYELESSGASQSDIMNFAKVQFMDLEKMSPEELVMRKMAWENPELDASDIRFEFEKLYGQKFDEDSDPDGSKARMVQKQMEIDSKKAAKFFEGKKVELSKPDSVRQTEEAREQRVRFASDWDSNLKLGNEAVMNVAFKDSDSEYSFDLKMAVPKEVRQELLNYAVSNGIQPTPENIAKIAGQAGITAFLQDPQKNLQAIARDAYAKGRESAMKAVDNPGKVERPGNGAQIKSGGDSMSALKKALLEKMRR